jgi:chromosome partitioning protein
MPDYRFAGRIIAIANQKGGVGKTTTAINLATALAAIGRKVVIIDLDPQGNASTGLGIDRKARQRTIYDVLTGEALLCEVAAVAGIPGRSVVPSSVDLSGAELELVTAERRSYRLREAIYGKEDQAPVDADYILIDCPPSLNLLTLNALVAASSVLVPLQCEFFALEGLSLLMRTIERVRAAFNPDLSIRGVVLTMFDKRNNLSQQVEQDVRSYLTNKVYKTVIPRNVRVSEAPSYGKPALLYDHKCVGSQAYIDLAKEVLRQERKTLAAA